MKKIMAVLLAALMMMSLAGCTQNQAGNESSSSEQESSSVAEVQPPVVADAALYRGTVTETSGQQLTVEQYDGRDYGEVVIVFTLPEEVENTFQEGEYVEIYYGASNTGSMEWIMCSMLLSPVSPVNAYSVTWLSAASR